MLGCAFGVILYKVGNIYGNDYLSWIVAVLSPFGLVLVNMLKMIVIPIIFFSLIYGAASMPLKTFGKMGLWVCGWYFFYLAFCCNFTGSG